MKIVLNTAFALPLLACAFQDVAAAVHTEPLDDFTEVTYTLPYRVELVATDSPFVRLEGSEDVFNEIKFQVRGDKLRIYEDRGWLSPWWSSRHADDVTLTVGYYMLEEISLTGSGDVFAAELEGDRIKLHLSGTGQVEVENISANDLNLHTTGTGRVLIHDAEVDTANSRLTGTGSIRISGTTNSQVLEITGSGKFFGRDLRAQETEAQITGTGNVQCWTEVSLKASITGSGDLSYFGNPQIDKKVTGSGKLKRL